MNRDARVTLARRDLAARVLQGLVPAARYADPQARVAILPAVALRRSPDPWAEQLDQLLFGEVFDVLDEQDGFAWGQARGDGYVGFVESAALVKQQLMHKTLELRCNGFRLSLIENRSVVYQNHIHLVVIESTLHYEWIIEVTTHDFVRRVDL